MIPTNEQEVIFLFAKVAPDNWEAISLSSQGYPDAEFLVDGEPIQIEFEFRASSFVDHKHDVFRCDAIICWEDDWGDSCPIPIIALSDPLWSSVDVTRGIDFEKAALFERSERIRLERRVKSLKDSLESVSSELSERDIKEIEDTSRIHATERRGAIFQMLLDGMEVNTKHLADMYKVTDQTIRNDLRYLSEIGKITYTKGKINLVEEGDF